MHSDYKLTITKSQITAFNEMFNFQKWTFHNCSNIDY